MLTPPVRTLLTWLTLLVVAVMLISGLAGILRMLARPSRSFSALSIAPPEVTLCAGESVTFAAAPLPAARWAATGGTIGADGRYIAGNLPGNYEVQAVGPQGERGRAYIHIVICTPTPPPTPTPIPTPTPTPTPPPTPIPEADPAGDLFVYNTGAAASAPFDGLDIRNSAFAADSRLLTAGLPSELAGWAQEGETVLWMALHTPIPEGMPVRADWFFVLDLDGNPGTGRPPGTRPVNQGLGDEVAVGLYYDPTDGAFHSYLLLWNAARRDFDDGGEPRYWLSPDRTLVALAVPGDVLGARGFVPEAARGRAATIAYTTPNIVADFYPQ